MDLGVYRVSNGPTFGHRVGLFSRILVDAHFCVNVFHHPAFDTLICIMRLLLTQRASMLLDGQIHVNAVGCGAFGLLQAPTACR